MTKVLVLGAGGMLGAMVARVLRESPGVEAVPSVRRSPPRGSVAFDAVQNPVADILASDEYEWIVNALGVIKPRIDESDPASVAQAIEVNTVFPHRLAAALRPGQRVIQIATDGVFSGRSGPYDEPAPHDAMTVYARTKSLGEVASERFLHLRCSVIGPESDSPRSLLGWARSRPAGARITGYADHRWNGVTTWHFAKLCEAVITGGLTHLPSPLHVVPGDAVTKAELLELALASFGRTDLELTRETTDAAVDRRLSTMHPEENRRLWAQAGYAAPPSIASMIEELAEVDRRMAPERG